MNIKALGLSLLTAGLLSATAQAADYKLTVPHVTNIDSYNHQSLLVFKNFVENHSNGAIEVDIYPSGQLCGTARECLSGVQSGIFDYFQTTIPELANYWAPVGAFDLPYMLPNDRVAECVYDNEDFLSDVRDNLLEETDNLRLMMVSNSGGWRNFATTNKQIKSPEDVKGLKIRTVPAPTQQELVKSLGGAPTPISWPEVYTALSTGVVDGTKNGIVDITTMKFEESLNYIILDGHAYMGGVWVMNNDRFEAFPDDLKRVIIDGVAAQNQFLRVYPKWKEYDAYETFRKAGGTVYTPTPEEKKAFQEATAPVRDFFIDQVGEPGKEWLDRFESEIKSCEAKLDADFIKASE
ncbi:TRAP-type C4-dicarboxylate transport system, substrate-binding protein [Cohaesibacter marisflavi]|uniref:TRAP-type C4-dicarboxylate transport system, substrate-binding protein n=1 Tax=Cohaesibacter marisflavi TaxID=655353 RepID=A0A1I5LWT4_9HYPH|nr:TRAP transporter substrate-binding protein DctP [Cohaesibacter marisflavi]SFP01643.1 TRAP-type C4-dicarboxylate transport system, substrate-binding protein [Cohaesibacter marisflavi]